VCKIPYLQKYTDIDWLLLGIILDMIEYLRTDSRNISTDQDLALWLENNFIRPFACIGRLDGLVVRDARETATLISAHERYSKVFPMPEGSMLPPQRLWVPGLEPVDVPKVSEDIMADVYGIALREPLEKYEMYRHYEVQTGMSLGIWTDNMGWTREIREAPKPKGEKERRLVPEQLPVTRLATNKSVPKDRISRKSASDTIIFSSRTGPRCKVHAGSKLTVNQRKLSDLFTNTALKQPSDLTSLPPDTPATLIAMAPLTAPLQLRWTSPLITEDQHQSFGSHNGKRVGIIKSRVRGELKIRKEAPRSSSPTVQAMETASVSSDGSSEDYMAQAVAMTGIGRNDKIEDECEEQNINSEALSSPSPSGRSPLVPSNPPSIRMSRISHTESLRTGLVSGSSAESADETEYDIYHERDNEGFRMVGADNNFGSFGRESIGGADTDKESEEGSITSESDSSDVASEYNDIMDLSE
jgi:hypothetical protein